MRIFSAKRGLRIWRELPPPFTDKIRKVVFEGLPYAPSIPYIQSRWRSSSTFCFIRVNSTYLWNWNWCHSSGSLRVICACLLQYCWLESTQATFIPQLSVKDQTAHLLLTAAEPFNAVLLQQLRQLHTGTHTLCGRSVLFAHTFHQIH